MPDFAVLLDRAGLDAFVRRLAQDRTVIGPVRRGDVIAFEEVTSADELPWGLAEEQEAGTYRLVSTGDQRAFAHTSPADSWRRTLFPPRTLLVRVRRSGDDLAVEAPEPEHRPLALLGVRGCDLAGIDVTDRVFAHGTRADPHYVAARQDAFIVAVGCSRSAPTCFCVSQDTGPRPGAGHDVLLTELTGAGDEPRLVAEAGSERGAALLSSLGDHAGTEPEPATDRHRAEARAVTERAAAQQHRSITPEDLAALADAVDDGPGWQEVAERCLACANCTLVCPTCFCSTTEDVTDLAGATAERWRSWDSCFTTGHSHIHGGPVHGSVASRYRQWLLHKLVTWHDQFDTSGCTGCGRCITWCPVGIDLTAEVRRLAERQRTDPAGAAQEAPT